MSEREKQAAEKLAEALNSLPDEAKEHLLAYGEGMAAMADKAKKTQETE